MQQPQTLVMSGRLEEFRLADVLQAVGSSPQCTVVELRRSGGGVQGSIWIEGGRVIRAEHGGTRGRDAFYDLFDPSAADEFVVCRVPQAPAGDSLGPVQVLLLDALERTAHQHADETAPVPPLNLALGSQVTPLPQETYESFETVWDEATVARPLRRGAVTLAIASARGGVGRSTIALHLARAFARTRRHVILIDADAMTPPPGVRTLDEILADADAIDETLREVGPDLRVLPVAIPPGRHSVAAEWAALLARARTRGDVLVIDGPAGFHGVAAEAIAACSHVLGIVRCDRTAAAAATLLEGHVDMLQGDRRPQLAGFVVNLFDGRSAPSVEGFHRITAHGVPLFETTIPRADVLADDPPERDPHEIAWLFDALAAEVAARTGLLEPVLAAIPWLPRR